MNFTELHNHIKSQFNPAHAENQIEGTGVNIQFLNFNSSKDLQPSEKDYLYQMRESVPGGILDNQVAQNNQFSYPVFIPPGKTINDKAIILLHGLNERKWDKYLAWGHYLAEHTNKSVIIFPMSFHMNRGLPDWVDPRLLSKKADVRKQIIHDNEASTTFVNLTLSERLTESPERFFLSGLQTAYDLTNLLEDINEGKHPLFEKGTHADFFAYSIGGLLAEVMFMANPKGLLSNSKLFLFCAGSMFTYMNGVSRVIMDKQAFMKIHKYYREDLEKSINSKGAFADFFAQSKIGEAFRAMIRPDRFKALRENFFRSRQKQLFAISLKNDKVIPAINISETLLGRRNKLPENMEVYDFPYPYTHEMPFPIKIDGIKDSVNLAFDKIFSKAAVFLA
jgi:Family of unknown function (DUF6051)